jgi:hypothetical protein
MIGFVVAEELHALGRRNEVAEQHRDSRRPRLVVCDLFPRHCDILPKADGSRHTVQDANRCSYQAIPAMMLAPRWKS